MAPLPGEEDPEEDLDSLDAQEAAAATGPISKPKKKSLATHSKTSTGPVLRKKKNASTTATSAAGTGTGVGGGALKTKKKMVLMR